MVSGVRLLLLVEADCGVGVCSHNPSGGGFDPSGPHPVQRSRHLGDGVVLILSQGVGQLAGSEMRRATVAAYLGSSDSE